MKNPGQFVQAFRDGADAVTASLDVLSMVAQDPAACEAEDAFSSEYADVVLSLP